MAFHPGGLLITKLCRHVFFNCFQALASHTSPLFIRQSKKTAPEFTIHMYSFVYLNYYHSTVIFTYFFIMLCWIIIIVLTCERKVNDVVCPKNISQSLPLQPVCFEKAIESKEKQNWLDAM